MKARGVLDRRRENGCTIFAPNRKTAVEIAKDQEMFRGVFLKDLRIYRMSELDGRRETAGALDWQSDDRLYYEAGWWPEGGSPSCDWCGRHEYKENLMFEVEQLEEMVEVN